jgi:hypothetical protein
LPAIYHVGPCTDGSVVVFFVCGEGEDRIACAVCHDGGRGKWSPIRSSLSFNCLDNLEQSGLVVSKPLHHSIQQVLNIFPFSSHCISGITAPY